MTWIGVLNFVVLQWFGVRLARVIRRVPVREDLVGTSLAYLGVIKPEERLHRIVTVGWTWLRWIWPLTGWWNDFRYIRRGTKAEHIQEG